MTKHNHPLIIALFFFFLLLLPSVKLHSWGFFGHRHINYHAVFLLPPELYAFYKKNIDYLADHSVDPDKRRYAIPEEGPRHYIDMDHYTADAYKTLPRNLETAVKLYSADSLHAHGIAPWWIMKMYGRLKRAFLECDAEKILSVSADIGHYIADIHVPLHANSNHNGQKSDQHGIHAFWESRLPELYAVRQYDMLIGRAYYLSSPAEFIWQRVHESALASDTVLSIEKKISRQVAPDKRFAYENRNGVVVRQYAERYAALYHARLNGMVERRMRDAIAAVASFWFTAWVDAGQPDISALVFSKDQQTISSSLDTLQSAWLKGNIIGRTCTN
ncbi:MAG: zinc dependent phospholipase C family protein [bacterium]